MQWLLLPTVNIATFNIALAHFAKAVGACETRRIILVIDGAGWHKIADLEWLVGVQALFLRAYFPELKPAKILWPLVREAPADRLMRTLDEVEALVLDRRRHLATIPEHIRACSQFSWWPRAHGTSIRRDQAARVHVG